MELEKNSDPDEDDDDDDEGNDGGGGDDGNVRKSFVGGKKPGYGMKTKPTMVAIMPEAAPNVELAKELNMTGELPDLGSL